MGYYKHRKLVYNQDNLTKIDLDSLIMVREFSFLGLGKGCFFGKSLSVDLNFGSLINSKRLLKGLFENYSSLIEDDWKM